MLLIGASAIVAACLLIARTVRCEEIIDSPVPSPNGKFVATSTLKACPIGFLSPTNCSVSVALSPKSRPFYSKNETLIFESTDAAEVPTLRWLNGQELVLRVNDIGEVQFARHELEGVRITYTVPRWMWDRLGTIEADRLHSGRESQALYNAGKLTKDDLRASLQNEDATARERSSFRDWVIANATVEDPSH